MNNGKVGDRVLLKPETVEELFKPQTMVTKDGFYPTARLTTPKWTTYGLGWFQQDYRGRAVDFHTGSIDGMVAIHGLLRDARAGVVVLANRDHAELRHAIMLNVIDRFIGGPAPRLERRAADALRRSPEAGRGRAKESRGPACDRDLADAAPGALRGHVFRSRSAAMSS